MKSSFYQKGISEIIVAIIIGIILVVGMYFFFRIKFPPTEMPEITKGSEESTEQKTEEEKMEVPEGYEYYYNQTYSFSLFYPKNWIKESFPEAVTYFKDLDYVEEFSLSLDDENLPLTIMIYNKNLSMQDIKNRAEKDKKDGSTKVLEIKEIFLNNRNGYETIELKDSDTKIRMVDFPIGNRTYYLGCKGRTDFYDKYCDTIINSFTIKDNEKTEEEKATNSSTDTQQWKEFSSVAEGFKMFFPTYPIREKEEVKLPTTNSPAQNIYYTSITSDKVIYSANLVIYPQEVDMKGFDLKENFLNTAIRETSDELISYSFTTFRGYQTLDYLAKDNTLNIYTKARGFLIDHTFYALMISYRNENYSESDYNRFINSFQLIK